MWKDFGEKTRNETVGTDKKSVSSDLAGTLIWNGRPLSKQFQPQVFHLNGAHNFYFARIDFIFGLKLVYSDSFDILMRQ